jgi:hypothetical protein
MDGERPRPLDRYLTLVKVALAELTSAVLREWIAGQAPSRQTEPVAMSDW